jgi:hypothetical protein
MIINRAVKPPSGPKAHTEGGGMMLVTDTQSI